MQSYKYFSHVSIMPTVTLNGVGRSDVCHYNVFYLCICGLLLKLVIIKFSDGCLIRGWNCLPAFASTWVQPSSGFWWVLFSFLCCVLYVFALCLVCPMLQVSLDCSFSKVYLVHCIVQHLPNINLLSPVKRHADHVIGNWLLFWCFNTTFSNMPVECTLFYNLQSWVQTHVVLVIGLYELLDPTT